jgi:hypothetical protein
MAPDSNTRTGCGPLWSTSAGILELGLIATKPLPNCSPWLMRTSQASYSAPLWPSGQQLFQHHRDLHAVGRAQRIQLQRVLAHRQFLVVRAPATGRLMLANRPPLLSGAVQTLGGM